MHVALANSRIVFLQLWSHQCVQSHDFLFRQHLGIGFLFLTLSSVIHSFSIFLRISLSFPSLLLSFSIMYCSNIELWHTFIYKISCALNEMELVIISLGSYENYVQ